jgi:iron complex outermembrane receptor protein
LKVRGGYGQTFRAPDMFNIYGRSDGFEFVPDFSKPGCFDGSTYICNSYQIASTRQADPNLKEEHGDDLGLGVIVNPLPGFQFTVDWYKIHLKDLVLTESAYDLVLKEWQCANGVLDGTSALCADVNNRVVRNGFDALERVIVQPINQSNLTRSGIDIQASYSYESAKYGAFNFNLGYSKVMKFELTRFKGDDPIDLKYGEPGSATPGNTLNFSLNWYQPLTTGKGIAAGIFVQRTGRVYNFDQSQFLEPFYDVNLSAAYQLNTRTSLRLNVNNVLNAEPQDNGSGFWPGFWAHLQTANALGRSAYVSIGYQFN